MKENKFTNYRDFENYLTGKIAHHSKETDLEDTNTSKTGTASKLPKSRPSTRMKPESAPKRKLIRIQLINDKSEIEGYVTLPMTERFIKIIIKWLRNEVKDD